MNFFKRWLTGLVYLFDSITLSPWSDKAAVQPVFDIQEPKSTPKVDIEEDYYPIFPAPNGPEGFKFNCSYPNLKGWKACSTPQNRGCWLRDPKGKEYNIYTDYEDDAPFSGTTRKYVLNATDLELHPDGVVNHGGQAFNQSYPGPWIQACWGDKIEVNVYNNLGCNGTTVHWHGIRQNGTVDMDGVNGITQCPIAPGKNFTYTFDAIQYGSTWYHSHYSLQYANGLLGPMTIYGPQSANYDDAKDPLLMTDWVHESVFKDYHLEVTPGKGPPGMANGLLNGYGGNNCTATEECKSQPDMYWTTFKEGKKYLLRLINASTDTTWIFSIDNHMLQVVQADLVPIKPYYRDHILVGIGQRYHVVVEATRPRKDTNYFIRIQPAQGCSGLPTYPLSDPNAPYYPYNLGIITYEGNPVSSPQTSAWPITGECSDEPYDRLEPIVRWKVGPPANEQTANTLQLGHQSTLGNVGPWTNISRWELGTASMWLNFSYPTIQFTSNKVKYQQDARFPNYTVIDNSKVTNYESWIWVIVTATAFPFGVPGRAFFSVAHPSTLPYWEGLALDGLKLDNPPRRDVALLPQGGYLVLAFRADNPGAWIMHCHIAWHASAGLAVQLIEHDEKIKGTVGLQRMTALNKTCDEWRDWDRNQKGNYCGQTYLQDDSGI